MHGARGFADRGHSPKKEKLKLLGRSETFRTSDGEAATEQVLATD
jgi:hypothetical protein